MQNIAPRISLSLTDGSARTGVGAKKAGEGGEESRLLVELKFRSVTRWFLFLACFQVCDGHDTITEERYSYQNRSDRVQVTDFRVV